MANSFDVNGIRAQINDKLQAAESIIALADKESRELSDQDRVEIDAHMSAIGTDSDEPTGLYKDLARAEKLESVSAEMAKKEHNSRAPSNNAIAVADGDDGWDNPRIAKARIRSLGFHRSTKQLHGFVGPDAERDAYQSGMWLRAKLLKDERAAQYCRDHGVGGFNQNKESVDADDGYLTPTPLSAAIWQVQNQVGLALKLAEQQPMTSDNMTIPKLTAGPTVYYPAEAAATTASKATFGSISLSAVKKNCLVKISNELIADSIIDVASTIAQRAGYQLSNQTDGEYIAGDGSGTYGSQTGCISALGAAGKSTLGSGDTSWSTITLADLNDVVALLPSAYTFNASWIVNRSMYSGTIQRLLYAAGGNDTSMISGGTFDQSTPGASAVLFGFPVYMSDWMPSDSAGNCAALFGDFRLASVLGMRQNIEVGMSTEFAWDEDVTTLRAGMRSVVSCHDFGDGADAGGVVGMFLASS